MNKKINDKNRIYILFYVITIVILFLDQAGGFPFTAALRKIKYVYLALMAIYLIGTFNGKLPKKNIPAVIVVFLMLLHTVLFGVVFTNPDVAQLTKDHFQEMMILIAMIVLTAYFFVKENMQDEFVEITFYAMCISQGWSAITHLGDFVNPLYFIYALSSDHSFRTGFGMDANYMGTSCLFALIFSVFLLDKLKGRGKFKDLLKLKKALIIMCIDVVILSMLFSVQSRTAILALAIFMSLYLFFEWENLFEVHISVRNTIYITVLLAVSIYLVMGGADEIWAGARRSDNITINYPFFEQFNKWTGMGYIQYSGFYSKAYGFDTFPVDIYYIYILFTTGYLGVIIISTMLIITLLTIVVRAVKNKKWLAFSMYVAILFTGIAQVSLFSWNHLNSMLNWMLILMVLCGMGDECEETKQLS